MIEITETTASFDDFPLKPTKTFSEKSWEKLSSNRTSCLMAAMAILIALIIAGSVALTLINSDIFKYYIKEISGNYTRILANDPDYYYIPIFGTNNLHGFFFPRIMKLKNFSYKKPGLYYFAKYLEIIREEFGQERVLWLDGGNQYTGSAELITSKKEIMKDYFNLMNITAATLGYDEYDLDLNEMKLLINKSLFPYLASNLIDNKTKEFKSIGKGSNQKEYGHRKYIIRNITLPNEDIIKIAILGVGAIVEEIGKRWENFDFDEISISLNNTINEIKQNNADINAIIGIIHSGINCHNNKSLNLYMKNMSNSCEGELVDILSKMEKGVLDAVISGEESFIVHDWVNDIPVINGVDGGQYTNILYLPFKKIDGKYIVVKDEVKIESPLPNCEKIFNNTKICEQVNNEEDYKKAGSLLSFKYHDIKMGIPSILNLLIDKYYPDYKSFNEDVICTLTGLSNTVKGKDNKGDDYIPNLITDIIREETESDFVIINSAGLQTAFNTVGLTKAEIMTMLPFDYYFCTVEITGLELKKILNIIQNGEKAYYPTSGLKQIYEVSTDNKKKLKEVKLWKNGKEEDIDENSVYKMGTIDYIAEKYGDDFAQIKNEGIIFNNIKCDNKNGQLKWNIRISDILKEMHIVDLSLYKNKDHPRLIEIKEETI